MTVQLDTVAINSVISEWYAPVFDSYIEEDRELKRRLDVIGPVPSWWRPFARREWRKAARKVRYDWATWCLTRAFDIKWGATE